MEIAAMRPRLRAAFAAAVAAAVGASLFATAQTRAADDTPTRNEHFTVDTNLLRPSGYTADELNAFVRRQGHASSGLAQDGDAFAKAEKDTGVNAQYLLAHAIHETGWGTSSIYHEKHNLFGIGAFDRNPNEAQTFKDDADCIDYMAHWVKKEWLTPGGSHFNGPTLAGMKKGGYATDPGWPQKIANIADDMYSPRAVPPPPPPTVAPPPTPRPAPTQTASPPPLLPLPTLAPQPPSPAPPAPPAPTAAPKPATPAPAASPANPSRTSAGGAPSAAGWPNTGLGGAA